MNIRNAPLVLTPALFCLPLLASADAGTLIYGNTSGWTVHTDPANNFRCFAEAQYEGGSTIRLGFESAAGGTLYLSLSDASWMQAASDGAPPLELKIDEREPMSFEPEVADSGALVVRVPTAGRASFLEGFTLGYTLNATLGDSETIMLSLGGSMRATRMLNECQDSMAKASQVSQTAP